MNLTAVGLNTTKMETFTSHRQARFIGPLLGFFLASVFPNIAIAKLGHIKIEYDPVPLIHPNQANIAIYQAPVSTWKPTTKPVEEYHVDVTEEPLYHLENHEEYPEIVSTNIETPYEYLIPPESKTNKVSVKRAIPQRYLTAYHRNSYTTRRRFPDYFEYDNYDYFTTPKQRSRKRNQGRRPIGFDDDYDYDYDYSKPNKKKSHKRRNKNKNRKGTDDYSDEDFDDVEPVTVVVRPRQQQQTTTPPTTTEMTTMTTTNIVNGSTPSTTTTTTNSTGYGYGSFTGNENISITYGPPSGIKPVYGVPGAISGTPLSEWTPSYLYDTPSSYYSHHQNSYYPPASHHLPSTLYHSPNSLYHSNSISYNSPSTSYGIPSVSYGSPSSSSSSSYSPSTSYGSPSATYGSPSSSNGGPSSSYGTPSSSYGLPSSSYGSPSSSFGAPSSSYGAPSSSHGSPSSSYGTPNTNYGAPRPPSISYGIPSQSYGTPSAQGSSHQSYQLPYSNWYGKGTSQIDLVRRAQDVIRYD